MSPSCSPSTNPTNEPSLSPTANATSQIELFLLARYGNSWDGVELMIESPDDPSFYSDAPSAGLNPKERVLNVSMSGTYLVGALFPTGPPPDVNVHDLECIVIKICCINESCS